jgi:hypothetical protein
VFKCDKGLCRETEQIVLTENQALELKHFIQTERELTKDYNQLGNGVSFVDMVNEATDEVMNILKSFEEAEGSAYMK